MQSRVFIHLHALKTHGIVLNLPERSRGVQASRRPITTGNLLPGHSTSE